MKVYEVELYTSITVTVEAEDEDQAADFALDDVHNLYIDWSIDGVWELEGEDVEY